MKLKLVITLSAICTALAALEERKKRRKKMQRRRQPGFRRICLIKPISSVSTTAWRQLISCGPSLEFLQALNFDRSSIFEVPLPRFKITQKSVFKGSPYRRTNSTRGRRPSVTFSDILGMVLWYIKSSGRAYTMCPIFGLVRTSISVWLDYGLVVLHKTVTDPGFTLCRISWPTIPEMKTSASKLEANRLKGTLLKGIFGVVDGGRFKCAEYVDPFLQNAYYEGYTCAVEVTNVFLFNFLGEVIHAGLKFPGSWHDSKVAQQSGLICPKLSDHLSPPGIAILADSAFQVVYRSSKGKIVRARKSNECFDIPSSALLGAIDLILQRIMPRERQSAEWGIRCFKGPFGLLRLPLPADSEKRKIILLTCAHLLNLRTRHVGLNQIRTVYSSDDGSNPWLQRLLQEQNKTPLE